MQVKSNQTSLSELDSTILLLLRYAKNRGVKNLSKAQINKIIYLLEVESRKLTGSSFFENQINFHRDERGPISISIKNSLDQLVTDKRVLFYEESGAGYKNPRHSHEIKDEKIKLRLPEDKIIFATSTFNILLNRHKNYHQTEITKEAYSTEPMKKILLEENGGTKLKGRSIDFSAVSLDEDLRESMWV